jgi:protein SCO1/2
LMLWPGELGHSINHSSLIYFLAPDTRVAGYAMHDQSVADIERTLRQLARMT